MPTLSKVSSPESKLIKALRDIVAETMSYPPTRPIDGESYLPPELIEQAQKALALYGLDIERNSAMATQGGAA